MVDQVVVGAYVLANVEICADAGRELVQECSRGIIATRPHDMQCEIAFLNKKSNRITYVTLLLPDLRILHPVQDSSNEGMESHSSSQ